MSNDILIDDSSAMAGNLVASVEAIANAVKDSGASFTSAFENLSKDFNSGFSKFIESSKSMNDELIKALESIKINIVNNYKIESEKKERVSKKKEEFGPTRKDFEAEQKRIADNSKSGMPGFVGPISPYMEKPSKEEYGPTRKDFEKNLKDVFENMKPGMPGFVGPMSPYTEKPSKEVFGPTIKDFEAEQKRIAENAKPGMPGFVGPIKSNVEEYGPTRKDFELNQIRLAEQANILADAFSELFKVTNQQVAAMAKSGGKTKGKAPDFEKTFKPVEDEFVGVAQQVSKNFSKIFEEAFKPEGEKYFNIKEESTNPASEKPIGLAGFSSVYGILESTLIADAEKAGNDLYTALEPIYGVATNLVNSFDDATKAMSAFKAINPLIDSYKTQEEVNSIGMITQELLQDVFDSVELSEFDDMVQALDAFREFGRDFRNIAGDRIRLDEEIYGISSNQSQSQQAQTYSGGQAYGLQNPPIQAQPTMFARQFYPLPNAQQQNSPLTTVQGMIPSLFSQIAGDMQKAGSEFGKILTPIFGNLGGTFGKSIAPFFTNPIAQVGKNLMQSGLQTAAGGAQGFGAFGGAGAVVGGAATAALGVGVVGFGAALTAVTGSVKMAGQAINSMASYVAKFSPATAEQMNLVFNDLQAVIGKALLPVFNAAIPIVRQFADFINFAMNALTPSIGIVTEAFQTIIPPLIELGATLIDAFMPVIRFAVSLLKGLAMVLEPIINGFAVLVDAVSMMFEIFTQGMDITQLMIDGFKLIADTTNVLVGAFNWVVAAFYAGVGTLMKVLAEAIDWVDGPGQRSWSKGIMEMGDQAIAGAKKIQMVSEEQMQAGLDGKKFSYKAGSLKGKEDIKKNSSFGMAVREAQAMSIESLGDTIRKAAITAQAPESQDKQEEYMKTVSENTAYEKQKKAMVDAIKESGLVNDSGTPSWDSPSGNDSYDPEADFMNAMMGNGVL